jgi:hypothetical protein
MLRLAAAFIAASLSFGCASGDDRWVDQCAPSEREVLARVDLKRVMDSLVMGLCPSGTGIKPIFAALQSDDSPLLVTDVVNIQTFVAGPMGLALGDVLKGSVYDVCRVPIRQVENVRDFRLNSSGFSGLSRDPERIREPDFSASDAIVATFSHQPRKLTLVGKRIAVNESTIVAVSTKTVTWSCTRSPSGTREMMWEFK